MKYKNVKVSIDGIRFDSKREANRYADLKLLERAGDIQKLECQPVFRIDMNGFHICKYIADFSYFRGNEYVVEDVKSGPTKTPVYRLKKKLVKAFHGIEITEIGA